MTIHNSTNTVHLTGGRATVSKAWSSINSWQKENARTFGHSTSNGRCRSLPLVKPKAAKYSSDVMKKSVTLALLAATIVTIAISAFALADTPRPPEHFPQGTAEGIGQDELLWWLPPDTESAVAARGPFPLPVSYENEDENLNQEGGKRKASQDEIRVAFEQRPLELFHGLFYALDLEASLRGSIVAFAMQGSRHFRDPLPGSEVMDFEGCSIIVFENSLGELGDNLVRTLGKRAAATEMVAGAQVLVLHGKSGDAEWDLFFAAPRPNVLLVANNLPYLRQVLERMGQRKNPRALPDQLPEWRFLDPATRFWGFRHYDRTQAKQDATSPFRADGASRPGDNKAIGILFSLDPNNQEKAVMTYFSGDETVVRDALSVGTSSEEAEIASFCGHEVITRDGGKTFEDEQPEEGVKYELRLWSPAPGVVERIYTLERTGTLYYFMFNMEVGLGRGMYL